MNHVRLTTTPVSVLEVFLGGIVKRTSMTVRQNRVKTEDSASILCQTSPVPVQWGFMEASVNT